MDIQRKKIAVIGLGYIGLPTAAMIASEHISVLGVDINPHIVALINEGRIHITEPFLAEKVHEVVKQGYLRAKTDVEPADVFLITVPTPFLSLIHI